MRAETRSRDLWSHLLWWLSGLPLAVGLYYIAFLFTYALLVCAHGFAKLAYMLQRSTAPQPELFWTGTAFREYRVCVCWILKTFSVPSFHNVPCTLIHVRCVLPQALDQMSSWIEKREINSINTFGCSALGHFSS